MFQLLYLRGCGSKVNLLSSVKGIAVFKLFKTAVTVTQLLLKKTTSKTQVASLAL